MRIFLSYAAEQRPLSEEIAIVLRGDGHRVFFDQSDLPPGETYDDRIRASLRDADLVVFLVSKDSLREGRYAQTELAIAQDEWPTPGRRVLPVLLDDTPVAELPAYLRSVTVLRPLGSVAAEIAAAVAARSRTRRALRRVVSSRWFWPLVVLAAVMAAALIFITHKNDVERTQRAALDSVIVEMGENVGMLNELSKNTTTLARLATTVRDLLRTPRFRILAGLFPPENADPQADQSQLADLYNQRMDWLAGSGLLEDEDEVRRHREACAAIVRTIDRTATTVQSLADPGWARYRVHDEVWTAQASEVQAISFADVARIPALYAAARDARTKYDRVARLVPEYLSGVRAFCSLPEPERAELGAALASERLTVGLLPAYDEQVQKTAADTIAAFAGLRVP